MYIKCSPYTWRIYRHISDGIDTDTNIYVIGQYRRIILVGWKMGWTLVSACTNVIHLTLFQDELFVALLHHKTEEHHWLARWVNMTMCAVYDFWVIKFKIFTLLSSSPIQLLSSKKIKFLTELTFRKEKQLF